MPAIASLLRNVIPQMLTLSCMLGMSIIPSFSGIPKGAGKLMTDGIFNLSAADVPGLHQKSLNTMSGLI